MSNTTDQQKEAMIAKGLLLAAKRCISEATYHASCLIGGSPTAQAQAELSDLITKVSVEAEAIGE